MAGEPRWSPSATLQNVQFDWEDKPTPRPVRLTTPTPKPGEPVRTAMGGAEVEGVIDDLRSAVLHVRLPNLRMQKADTRRRVRRKLAR